MGGMDGLDLVREIQRKYPAIDTIIMSGFTGDYTYGEVIEAGAVDFIAKPIALPEFEAKITRVNRERKALAELKDAHEAIRRSFADMKKANEKLSSEIADREKAEAELQAVNDRLEGEIETRKKVEGALSESEQRFRSLFEHHRATMLITDPDSCAILDVNAAAEQFYGFSRAELCAMHIAEINQLPRAEIAEALQSTVKGERNRFVFPHRVRSGEIRTVEAYSSPIEVGGRTVLFSIVHDITERKRAEELIRIRLSLLEFAASHSLEELLQKTLDEVGALTGSPIGFYHFVERDQKTLSLQAWSTQTMKEFCKAEGKGLHYSIDQAGVWVDCVHEGRPVIHNDYSALSHRKGMPAGHAPVIRELVVPILRSDQIVAILGIGNKPTDYNDKDVEVVSYLADVAWEITERKLMEEKIRQTNAYLENILQKSPDAIGIVDRHGKFIKWNRAAAEQYGYQFEELGGMSAFSLYADKDEFESMLAELRREGTVKNHEISMKKKDGTVAVFGISISLLRNEANEIIGSVSMSRDLSDIKKALTALEASHEQLQQEITVRLQAEAALNESRQELVNIIDFLPDATLVINNEGKVIAWNKAIEELTGVRASDMLGKGDYEYSLPFYGERRPILIDLTLKPQEEIETKYLSVERCDCVLTGETYTPALKKEKACLVGRATVLRGSDGSIKGAVESIRDITELRKTQDELCETNVEMTQLLASIPSFLIGLTPEQRITRWNPAAEKIFGISSEVVLGERLDRCGVKWDQLKVSEAISLCQKNNAAIRLDGIRFLRPDGKEGFLTVLVSSIEGEGTGSTGMLLLGNDVTERKIMESQLVQAQKLESIGQLAAGIAHEINTPAQYVGDNARFLQEAYGDLERVHDLYDQLLREVRSGNPTEELVRKIDAAVEEADLEYIRQEAPKAVQQSLEGIERISRIVRAMKEFSHPGTDAKTNIDLNRAIESTITVARNEWKYVAEMVTDFDPGMPLVPCLPSEINQVVLNMIINASHAVADALKQNGSDKKGTITIATRALDGHVEIRISDTGTGIPENIRSKIFDPFFTTKEVGKGTGQGLAISHSVIVDKHRGTITLDPEVDRGASFIIRLPLQSDSEK
jgi:PAS domain S-box-containing protein